MILYSNNKMMQNDETNQIITNGLIDELQVIIEEQYTEITKKRDISNKLILLKKYANKKEKNSIDIMINILKIYRFTKSDRNRLKQLELPIKNVVKRYEEEYNEKSNEDDIEKNQSVDEIEANLDRKNPDYKSFNDKHPMKGVTYTKKNVWRFRNDEIDKTNKELKPIINLAKQYCLTGKKHLIKNSLNFPINKIQKNIIQFKENILIEYKYNNKSYYDIRHIFLYIYTCEDMCRKKYKEIKNKINGYFLNPNRFGGYVLKELLSLKNIKKLLTRVRAPNVLILTNMLNIKTLGYKFINKETSASYKIISVFKKENIVPQYRIGTYYIDLYFPNYKLAIECDEHNHSNRDKTYEKKRQKYIENKLGATFIRFNPDERNFDILNVISDIHYYMKNHDK